MRRLAALCCGLLFASTALLGESKNPADYPLRIHVFTHNGIQYLHNRATDEVKGDGRANLFLDGDVKGVDFTFDCSEKLRNSFGYETYPAKWKKPNQELTVLLPVFGKTGAYFTCNFKTGVKDETYLTHDGKMGSEPSSAFKAWMVKHDYDPVHGKNSPTKTAAKADQ